MGKKLTQCVATNAAIDATATRNYIAGFEYNGSNTLQHIATAEGRYVMGAGYEYFLKDHLGNVRVALNASGTQTQSTMYYPFGLTYSPITGTNKYTYNGKELMTDFGLGLNDYGARMYDGATGRWNGVDALSEKYAGMSNYAYVMNNPMRFIDPDGKEFVDANGKHIVITTLKDGSLTFSNNATEDVKRSANALNLTEEGRNQLHKIDASDIKVKLSISPDAKIRKNDDGTTSYTFGETIQGNFNEKDNYGKKVNRDGTYGIKEATIIIYEGTIKESIKSGSGLKHEGLTLEQAVGAVVGHEGTHGTNKAEINKDLKAEMGGKVRNDKEDKPNQIEKNIIQQYNLQNK